MEPCNLVTSFPFHSFLLPSPSLPSNSFLPLLPFSLLPPLYSPSGPGFPGYPAPPARSASSPQRSATDSATNSSPRRTPIGLFQTQRSNNSSVVISEPARPLQERQDSYTFSAATLTPNREVSPSREQAGAEGEEVRSKLTTSSATTPDPATEEIRRKRLERLNSLPNTPSSRGLDPAGDVNKNGTKPSAQQPKDIN